MHDGRHRRRHHRVARQRSLTRPHALVVLEGHRVGAVAPQPGQRAAIGQREGQRIARAIGADIARADPSEQRNRGIAFSEPIRTAQCVLKSIDQAAEERVIRHTEEAIDEERIGVRPGIRFLHLHGHLDRFAEAGLGRLEADKKFGRWRRRLAGAGQLRGGRRVARITIGSCCGQSERTTRARADAILPKTFCIDDAEIFRRRRHRVLEDHDVDLPHIRPLTRLALHAQSRQMPPGSKALGQIIGQFEVFEIGLEHAVLGRNRDAFALARIDADIEFRAAHAVGRTERTGRTAPQPQLLQVGQSIIVRVLLARGIEIAEISRFPLVGKSVDIAIHRRIARLPLGIEDHHIDEEGVAFDPGRILDPHGQAVRSRGKIAQIKISLDDAFDIAVKDTILRRQFDFNSAACCAARPDFCRLQAARKCGNLRQRGHAGEQ